MDGVVGVECRVPKPAGLSFGSPSFSILFLQINEIEEYLVVARCTEMWLRMRRVPSISPSTKIRRKHKSRLLNPILGEQTVYLIQDFDPFLVSISQFVGQFPANCRVGRFLHGTSRSTATGIIVRRQAFPVPITALAPV